MKTIYLEQRSSSKGTEHNKFYRITDNGQSVITEWGAIGTPGKSAILFTTDNFEMREKIYNSKLNSKIKKGYVPIIDNGEQVEFRPSRNGRNWGVEIETHSRLPLNIIVQKMRDRKLSVNQKQRDYFKSTGRQWDVKRDGSCGYEFASPILAGESGYFDAKLAVEKIREVCPTATNAKCGLHVTVDVSDHNFNDIKKLIVGYLLAQDYFYNECNDSRQHNQYCIKNPVNRIRDIVKITAPYRTMEKECLTNIIKLATPEGRRHGLNLSRLNEKKVIEFRMMESTVGIRKVGGWIRLCVNFIDGLKNYNLDFNTQSMSRELFDNIIMNSRV